MTVRKTEANLVDMIGTARATQLSGTADGGFIKLLSPAKVNLFLEIGGKQPNGYHQALSLMHTLMLHDIVYMRRSPNPPQQPANDEEAAKLAESRPHIAWAGPESNIAVMAECFTHEGVAPLNIPARKNIVFRAVDELARELDRTESDAIEFRIDKHIPHEGGLGGGSSNAAAALVGLAGLWGIGLDHPAIERVAQRIGSDVAFFLKGSCGLYSGTGDVFEKSLAPMNKSVVLVKPDEGVSTAAAYRAFDEQRRTVDETLHQKALAAERAQDVPLYNNLALAGESVLPLLGDIRAWLENQPGVEGVLLCGSGSTTIALCDSFATSCRIVVEAQAQNWWARATDIAPLRAAKLPQR